MTNEQLIELARAGDEGSLKMLFENNEDLMYSLAKQFRKRNEDIRDLISECKIAFYKAYQDFDQTKGNLFSTVAYKYIYFALCNMRKLEGYEKRQGKLISLEIPTVNHKNGEKETIGDRLEDTNAQDKYEKFIQSEFLSNILDQFLQTATDAECGILKGLFIDNMQQKLVGIELGIPESTLKVIKNRMFAKMRAIAEGNAS